MQNFRFLVDWVHERYRDLLGEKEQAFLQRFHQLEQDSQRLLVRLSSRKGPLFRRNKLDYSEITNLDLSAQQFIQAGLLHSDIPISLETLTNALTKPELLTLFSAQLTGLKQARKEILVQQLQTQFTEPQCWKLCCRT